MHVAELAYLIKRNYFPVNCDLRERKVICLLFFKDRCAKQPVNRRVCVYFHLHSVETDPYNIVELQQNVLYPYHFSVERLPFLH